jgi:hypothetical protein
MGFELSQRGAKSSKKKQASSIPSRAFWLKREPSAAIAYQDQVRKMHKRGRLGSVRVRGPFRVWGIMGQSAELASR